MLPNGDSLYWLTWVCCCSSDPGRLQSSLVVGWSLTPEIDNMDGAEAHNNLHVGSFVINSTTFGLVGHCVAVNFGSKHK